MLGMVQAAVLSYLPIFSIQVLGFDKTQLLNSASWSLRVGLAENVAAW